MGVLVRHCKPPPPNTIPPTPLSIASSYCEKRYNTCNIHVRGVRVVVILGDYRLTLNLKALGLKPKPQIPEP